MEGSGFTDVKKLAAAGTYSILVDNLTSDGVRSYTWSARNKLASLTGPVNGSFAYDGFGRRRSKTIGGTTTQYLYDGLNPVQELASGTPTANVLTGFGTDEFFTRTDAGGVRNYLIDALGSSVALADGSGTVQTEYTYEPFGKATTTGSSSTNSFAYTGREVDGTGLYYYRARYYHPGAQRFVAEDPLGFAGGDVNLSAYVSNNAPNLTDPLGLQSAAKLPPLCEPGELPSKTVMNDWGATCIEEKIAVMPYLPTGPLFGKGGGGGGSGRGRGARGSSAAAEGGAKSAAEYAKHQEKLTAAREALEQAREQLDKARRASRRGDIREMIEKLKESIKGHEKEINQKWPNSGGGGH
jgi:RHS repeat-associated protein